MLITRNFKDTVRERAARDPRFREELLAEVVECLLSAEITTARIILRDYLSTMTD